MHLYIAAQFTNNYRKTQNRYAKLTDVEQNIMDTVPNVLESYHYIGGQRFVDVIRQENAKIFLDSGAFSAHSLGVEIDINAYCEYIIRNRDILRVEDGAVMASVLDGIGDPLKTYQNQMYMMEKGATPLPCYHYSEPIEYLHWYVANFPYVTIGGLVGRAQKDQERWLDEIFEKGILDGSGRPKVKTHAFGMTSPDLMKRYPWWSCDSSSWIQAAAFGSIFTSEHGPLAVSKDSPAKHDAGRHLSNLTPIEQNSVNLMLQSKGFSYERLSTVYESRASYNCLGYMELNNLINEHIANQESFQCTKMQSLF